MSPPDHDTTEQVRRHRPALTGILLSLVVAAVLLVLYIIYIGVAGTPPEGADTQIDGLTGREVEG